MTDVLGIIACLLALAAGVAAHRSGVDAHAVPSPARAALLLALAALSATCTFAVTFAPLALRVPVVVISVLLAPGYALVAGRRIDGALDELTVALGLGIALLIAVGTAMAVTGLWVPVELHAATALVVAPVLAWRGASLLPNRAARTEVTHV